MFARMRTPGGPRLCVARSHTMHEPSLDALTASSPPPPLRTASALTGPLWSLWLASIDATPLTTRHTRTMPGGGEVS
jgi:hypothetical protein